MLRLIVATLAIMYIFAITVGDRPEGEAVARAADPGFDTSLASFIGISEASASSDAQELAPRLSDEEAIQVALATGTEMRKGRSVAPLLGTGRVVEMVADAKESDIIGDIWMVTGDVVNLRAGPGTGNEVVAKLNQGTEAEMIDEGDGWYRIRTADGAVDGWIYGRYLEKTG